MAKLSEKYETMVVYSLKNGESQIETLKSKFTALIEDNATLVSVNEWGKRRLAYPINYETDGYYVLYGFDSEPSFPKEFERVLNINEGVIRFLTVVRAEAPAKPDEDNAAAAATQKSAAKDITGLAEERDESAVVTDTDDEEDCEIDEAGAARDEEHDEHEALDSEDSEG